VNRLYSFIVLLATGVYLTFFDASCGASTSSYAPSGSRWRGYN
jgi:hypothetical protein